MNKMRWIVMLLGRKVYRSLSPSPFGEGWGEALMGGQTGGVTGGVTGGMTGG